MRQGLPRAAKVLVGLRNLRTPLTLTHGKRSINRALDGPADA
jgi:hypothetical protein